MKKIIGFSVSICVIAALLAVVTPRVRGAEDITAQIEAANRAFKEAFEKGDAAAVASCYTKDAQVMAAGMESVTGTASIEKYWKAAMQPGVTFTLTTLEVEQHGDTAIEGGRVDIFASGNSVDQLKYIVIWKRIDGQWKLHRDIFTTNLPASAAK
ncbi:MAG: DUF4440 domain-containing protein [Candidatus Hydrogenedentota bacterium]